MSAVRKKGIKDDQEVWGWSPFVCDNAINGEGEDWGPREGAIKARHANGDIKLRDVTVGVISI